MYSYVARLWSDNCCFRLTSPFLHPRCFVLHIYIASIIENLNITLLHVVYGHE